MVGRWVLIINFVGVFVGDLKLVAGVNVRRLRVGCGLSQRGLGRELGLCRRHVARIEAGKCNSIDTLGMIAVYFGVEVVDLLVS